MTDKVWFDFVPGSPVTAIALCSLTLPQPVLWRGQGPFSCTENEWPGYEARGCFERLDAAQAAERERDNLRAYYYNLTVKERRTVALGAGEGAGPDEMMAATRAVRAQKWGRGP